MYSMSAGTSPQTIKNLKPSSTAGLLVGTHAHNDYLHPSPLYDALTLGFSTIEVDVYLINDKLYVSHLPPLILDDSQTLEQLYLKPLYHLYQIYPAFFPKLNQANLTLMIDIKTEKDSTYDKIKETLLPFTDMLSSWRGDKHYPGAISILLSGNRPIEKVRKEPLRIVQIDGRITDLGKNYPASLMPIISDNYTSICQKQWFGNTPNKKNMARIRSIAQQIHQSGKQFRLWNIHDNLKTWKKLLDAGVDVINTDDIEGLAQFMTQQLQIDDQNKKILVTKTSLH